MATVTIEATSTVLDSQASLPPAELAAAAFLARYRGRTLDSYRHDLRSFFAWALEVGLDVLSATRPQLELYVRHLEDIGLAPSTIRPAGLHRLWVLPLRPCRRRDRL